MADDFVVVEPLPLSAIRATLIRLEETIIFGLIERAQFAQNSPAYDAVCVHFWWFCWFLGGFWAFCGLFELFSSFFELFLSLFELFVITEFFFFFFVAFFFPSFFWAFYVF
jgi:hypothetical protein